MNAVSSLEHVGSIDELAAAMRDMPPEVQLALEPIHLFAPGIYVRVLKMPAGSTIVSKIHKTEHFCLALTGRATVVVGQSRELVVGPRLIRTMPGTQRALHVHEDAVWITFHPTEQTDLELIERELIAESFDDPVLANLQNLQHLQKPSGDAR